MAQKQTEGVAPGTYRSLRRQVGSLLRVDRGGAEQAKAARYWEVGKRIHEVLEPLGGRGSYGERVVMRLSQDVDVQRRLLYDMLRLYRAFPKVHARALLGWTHYRILLRVASRKAQQFYAGQATREGWSSRQLDLHIRDKLYERAQGGTSEKWVDLPRGRPFTYAVTETVAGDVRLELGFGIRAGPVMVDLSGVTATLIVESVRSTEGTPFRARRVAASADEIYTYGADVLRVVDGDTLRVRVDLGFGMEVEETVRLRGIDAPEMSQAEGEQARRFVDEALRATRRVVVATRQRDKYGRWLADLYYEPQTRSVRRMAREGRLLNRQLVAEGLAARYR